MNWFIGSELGSARGVESPNLEKVKDRCPEKINKSQFPFQVYTQNRPSSLLSRVTGPLLRSFRTLSQNNNKTYSQLSRILKNLNKNL